MNGSIQQPSSDDGSRGRDGDCTSHIRYYSNLVWLLVARSYVRDVVLTHSCCRDLCTSPCINLPLGERVSTRPFGGIKITSTMIGIYVDVFACLYFTRYLFTDYSLVV